MRTFLALLALLALFGVSQLLACGADGDVPGFIIMPGMVTSVAHEAYDDDPVTGPTLRLPPEGAVPLGQPPCNYALDPRLAADPDPEVVAKAWRAVAERAGRELHNPLTATTVAPEQQAVDLARGEHVFTVMCRVCHGPQGDGDGPIIGVGRFPNPPSLHAEKAHELTDGQMYHILHHGQGLMPSYAAQVRPTDRWRVIVYLRQLQRERTATPPPPSAKPIAAPNTTAAPPPKETP